MKKTVLAALLGVVLAQAEYRVVGYIPDYRTDVMADIHWSTLTHAMAAFMNPDANGNFAPTSSLQTVIDEIKTHPTVKFYVSIGGGAVDKARWLDLMSTSKRAQTALKIATAAQTMGAQGVDVDLEGDLVNAVEYAPFVSELYKALNAKGLKMTAAVAKWTSVKVPDSTFAQFEFINLMAYDYTGPWATTGNHAHSTIKQAQDELTYYGTTRGIAKNKIVLGVPFYGYDFANLSNVPAFTWSSVVNQHPEGMDVDSLVNGSVAMHYNGRPTIYKKSQMAVPYGGVMIWELGQDYFPYGNSSLLYQINRVKDSLANLTVAVQKPWLSSNRLLAGESYSIHSADGKLILNAQANAVGEVNLQSLKPGSYYLRTGRENYQWVQP